MTTHNKRCDAWCERNKGPILHQLKRILPRQGLVLEIGSGSGQHAEYFSRHLAPLLWQPSDVDESNLASIRAWRADAGQPNFLEPLHLDVISPTWPVSKARAIFGANMIHVAPWKCCLGLLAGARRSLSVGGCLVLYGPFRIGGHHTSESNAVFDENLQSRNPQWGIRSLEAVVDSARGMTLEQRIEMPANNQLIVFRRVARRHHSGTGMTL